MEWYTQIDENNRLAGRLAHIHPKRLGDDADPHNLTIWPHIVLSLETRVTVPGKPDAWVSIAETVSVEGDVAPGIDANGLERDPTPMRIDRVRSALLPDIRDASQIVTLADLHTFLRWCWREALQA